MPIYEYECSKCGRSFEVLQKIREKPLTRCKFCKGKVERMISNSSFQLKGSGWYVTDYARKSSGGKEPSSSPGDSTGGTSGSSSGESAPTKPSKTEEGSPKKES